MDVWCWWWHLYCCCHCWFKIIHQTISKKTGSNGKFPLCCKESLRRWVQSWWRHPCYQCPLVHPGESDMEKLGKNWENSKMVESNVKSTLIFWVHNMLGIHENPLLGLSNFRTLPRVRQHQFHPFQAWNSQNSPPNPWKKYLNVTSLVIIVIIIVIVLIGPTLLRWRLLCDLAICGISRRTSVRNVNGQMDKLGRLEL